MAFDQKPCISTVTVYTDTNYQPGTRIQAPGPVPSSFHQPVNGLPDIVYDLSYLTQPTSLNQPARSVHAPFILLSGGA